MQANITRSLAYRLGAFLLIGVPFGSLSLAVFAQQTTTTSTQPKGIQKSVDIDSAQVIYVSGDNVVLRNSDGSLQLLAMASGVTIPVDGKPVAPRDLKPGTQISHVHVNSVQQSLVTEVTQIDGTVLRVLTPSSVILRLGDGTVNRYTIPPHATFQGADGREIRSSDLRRGMSVSATVVRTSTMDTHSRQTTVTGSNIATPPQKGTLLIFAGKEQAQ
jgi:hypothetical protein